MLIIFFNGLALREPFLTYLMKIMSVPLMQIRRIQLYLVPPSIIVKSQPLSKKTCQEVQPPQNPPTQETEASKESNVHFIRLLSEDQDQLFEIDQRLKHI